MALVLVLCFGMVAVATAQQRDEVTFEEPYEDPAITEIKEAAETMQEAAKAKTEEILARVAEDAEVRKDEAKKLRFDLSGLVRPESPDDFKTRMWHFPPTPQYLTGACWSFAATSFMESEIKRSTGQEIKLSEMWTVYWEFVNKAEGYIESRGETLFAHGSQSGALLKVLAEKGVVPRSIYEGELAEDGRFNQFPMHERIMAFLEWCKENNYWDKETIITMVRRLLDETMGRPPEAIRWDGADMSPTDFLSQVCQIDPADYVAIMSTMAQPFHAFGEYRVPDNWWHEKAYLNLPLVEWYSIIKRVVRNGGTLVLSGDVSEPGFNGFEDVAVIPSFDIPNSYIDQSAREFRFNNGSTTDDHGIHLVGHTRIGNHDWFLIKDSNRSSRHGKFEGYFMYRDDYILLKTLAILVHRDVVSDILSNIDNEGTSP